MKMAIETPVPNDDVNHTATAQKSDADKKQNRRATGLLLGCIDTSTKSGEAAFNIVSKTTSKKNTAPTRKKKPSKWNSSAPYQVSMSPRFLILSIGMGAIAPFILGRAARSWLLSPPQPIMGYSVASLPPPVLGAAEELPPSTEYSTKHYEVKGTGSESFLVRTAPLKSTARDNSNDQDNSKLWTTKTRSFSALSLSAKASLQLSSESQVVELLNELVAESRDTILSYHCHQVAGPRRISCAGIASRGHIVLHTFPGHVALEVYGIALDADSTKAILGQSLTPLKTPTTTTPTSLKSPTASPGILTSSKSAQVTSAFIQPAMFVHEKPETVVLVGGSASTLSQILLHNTVERVILLESDAGIDEVCSPHCDRVEVSLHSAREWFAQSANETVDVIFVEPLHQSLVESVSDINSALKEAGLLVVQTRTDDSEASSMGLWVEELKEDADCDAIKKYRQGAVTFLISFASDESLGRWFANEAEVNLAIRERIAFPLPYFDGATMLSYQYPSRLDEDIFCLEHPEDASCKHGHGLDPSKTLVPLSSFEVKLSTVENAGRGVYLKHDADAGSYVFVDGCVENIHIPDATVRIMEAFAEGEYEISSVRKWETLMWYTSGYGFVNEEFGPNAHDVDPGIGTFVNHGCNGTTNVGAVEYTSLTEYSSAFDALEAFAGDRARIYNPAYDRAIRTNECSSSIALRRITRGEEIFNNYMTFETTSELEEYAESLRNECSGRQVGQVSEYELSAQGNQILRPQLQIHANNSEGCLHCSLARALS